MPAGSLAAVLEALRAGKAAVIPTDTVYGLAISPLHAASPSMLNELKGRPSDKPVAWLLADGEGLDVYGEDVPDAAQVLARAFWPGALTLVVRASDAVPAAFASSQGTIGLRVPDDVLTRSLAAELGCPLAVTSANLSGRPAPYRFRDIDEALLSQVVVAIDDDREKSGIASTVVDCTSGAFRIVREGAITESEISAVLEAAGVWAPRL